jgi:hypothetical protein
MARYSDSVCRRITLPRSTGPTSPWDDRVEEAMNLIEPYPVWIGHGGEAHDFRRLLDAGIEAVVELAVEEPSFPPRREMIACRFPLLDGVGNPPHVLSLAIRTVATLVEAKVPLLVCCADGMSRAPAVVAAAISTISHEPPEQCLKRVTWHHPSDVSPGLWSDVCQAASRSLDG